jgi:3-dehydroquinate synthase
MRHILLYGPSGSGKSTLGALLAQDLDMPFLDLDKNIEAHTGIRIGNIMRGQGEEAFRDLESLALKEGVSQPAQVIALGGGALLRAQNRALAEAHGQVVFLQTSLAQLVERLAQDEYQRPLLAGELESSLKALLEKREAHYASFPLRVDAGLPPREVLPALRTIVGRHRLRAMGAPYDVIVREGGLEEVGELLTARGCQGPILLVSDEHVAPLYAERVCGALSRAGFESEQVLIPAGEEHKTVDTVTRLWRAALAAGLDRESTFLALGGGVVSDLTGFAAATFMRGCNWAVLPTTLLSMADASIGGKTGFDLPEGKNLAGAFYPPRFVLADPQVLSTLPRRELRGGLAEVLKHGVIADPLLFELCAQGEESVMQSLPQVVKRAVAVKVNVIEQDPYEHGIRAALNFGHTVGHAVELASAYSLQHGEAVAIGMAAETRLAERLGIAPQGLTEQINAALEGLGLPRAIPTEYAKEELVDAMRVDKKKASGVVRFALPVKIGEVRPGVAVDDLALALEE